MNSRGLGCLLTGDDTQNIELELVRIPETVQLTCLLKHPSNAGDLYIHPQKKLNSVYPCKCGNSSSTSILELEQLMLFFIRLRFIDSTSAKNTPQTGL